MNPCPDILRRMRDSQSGRSGSLNLSRKMEWNKDRLIVTSLLRWLFPNQVLLVTPSVPGESLIQRNIG